MINIQFSITNPWANENKFDNLFCKSASLAKHKAVEFEICKDPSQVFTLSFLVTTRRDHAGASLELGLLGYSVHAQLYDTRHWDYEANEWEIYG